MRAVFAGINRMVTGVKAQGKQSNSLISVDRAKAADCGVAPLTAAVALDPENQIPLLELLRADELVAVVVERLSLLCRSLRP